MVSVISPFLPSFHCLALLLYHTVSILQPPTLYIALMMATYYNDNISDEHLPPDELVRRREWNRGPMKKLFPRIPTTALEQILDICTYRKRFWHNFSKAPYWNARRFSSITVAHVRHAYTDYDQLLRGEARLDRYEARHKTSKQVWKILRDWCPWDESNDQLERSFQATLLRPEERDPDFDPMEIDPDSEFEDCGDPMDLD